MRSLLLLFPSILACGPRVGHIVAAPVGARDGQRIVAGPLEVAVVGQAATAPDALFDVLRVRDPALVVLAGDAVPRSRAADWNALSARTVGLRVAPMAGAGERDGDLRLRGHLAAWTGLGVSDLGGPVPWYAVDLVSEGICWRFVVLDGDRDALGNRWIDQLFWLPKVVGDSGYDHLILSIHGGPGRMDPGAPGPSPGAQELLDLARRHADPLALVLVISGGGSAPGVVLPGGRWGEGWLTTGRSTPPAAALLRRRGDLTLEAGLTSALLVEFERRASRSLDGLRVGPGFAPPGAPVAGFWTLGIDGSRLTAQLELHHALGWFGAYALVWSPDGGWRAVD